MRARLAYGSANRAVAVSGVQIKLIAGALTPLVLLGYPIFLCMLHVVLDKPTYYSLPTRNTDFFSFGFLSTASGNGGPSTARFSEAWAPVSATLIAVLNVLGARTASVGSTLSMRQIATPMTLEKQKILLRDTRRQERRPCLYTVGRIHGPVVTVACTVLDTATPRPRAPQDTWTPVWH